MEGRITCRYCEREYDPNDGSDVALHLDCELQGAYQDWMEDGYDRA